MTIGSARIESTHAKSGASNRKRSVDLAAVEEAVNDNRVAVWMEGNGLIHMRNNRSKKEITLMPTYDMESWMDD